MTYKLDMPFPMKTSMPHINILNDQNVTFHMERTNLRMNTVNDRLSAAALIKVFRPLGAALIRLRRLF